MISASLQRQLRTKSADDVVYFGRDRQPADDFCAEMIALGCKARVFNYNDGSKEKPVAAYKVHVWGAR